PTNDTLKRVGLSLTLGGGEVRLIDMTTAYSAFVNGGYRVDPVAILKVTDMDGKVLEDNTPQKGKRVLSEGQAFLVSNILSDNEARKDTFGLNSYLNIANTMAKTGTTNDRRDNWTIGGNGNAMVGVWVGNNDNSPMLSVASGVSGASPIWNKVTKEALKGKPEFTFKAPGDITQISVDTVSGYAAHDNFPARNEYFIRGTEPTMQDPIHVMLKVCKSDGKLATPSDVASGNYDTKEFYQFKEEDPTAAGGANRWQEGILSWMNSQSDSRYHPPTEYCGTSNPLSVGFTTPHDHDSDLPTGERDVVFTANSSSAITQVDLKLNGSKVCTFNNGANNYTCKVNFPSKGIYTIEAVAMDSANHQSASTITVGVGQSWSATPTPSPLPTATP
ncbi:MAG: 1A family penicillin-binding protein, partial [uncultured bacterium]